MTINNKEAYDAALIDWAILDGCFGDTRIKPTDVDGLVERNGHFLYLEAKTGTASIKTGQSITFRRLSADPNNTVFVIWFEPHTHPLEVTDIKWFRNGRVGDVDNPSLEYLRTMVARWFNHANGWS